jgi:hypothetical protein
VSDELVSDELLLDLYVERARAVDRVLGRYACRDSSAAVARAFGAGLAELSDLLARLQPLHDLIFQEVKQAGPAAGELDRIGLLLREAFEGAIRSCKTYLARAGRCAADGHPVPNAPELARAVAGAEALRDSVSATWPFSTEGERRASAASGGDRGLPLEQAVRASRDDEGPE